MVDSDWDGCLKRLIGQAPQDFVSWLMQGATYVQQCSSELELHGLNADILYEIAMNGERCLLHIEFQSSGNVDMARRVLEYNVLAHRKYGLKIYSYVIYLIDRGTAALSPYTWETCCRQEPSRFHFEVIRLWDYSIADLKRTGLKVLLPLLPLAHDSGQVDNVLDEVMLELDPSQEPSYKELLVVAYGVLSYTYTNEADQHKIRRRYAMLKDILKDSWGFQEIMQEGREEGLREGLREGLKEGLKEGQKKGLEEGLEKGQKKEQVQSLHNSVQLLHNYIEARFPELFILAKERIAHVEDVMLVQKLTLEITLARDAAEVQRLLRAIE